MTNKEITLCFAYNLLTLPEDPRGFAKWRKRRVQKNWSGRNPGVAAQLCRASRKIHGHKYTEKNALRYFAWVAENKEHRNQWLAGWRKEQKENNPQYRLANMLRARLRNALAGNLKADVTKKLLGCDWMGAVECLESTFQPGMTWKNHGEVWHIDHKRPCASFDLTDPEQQRQCFHYTNLQALPIKENLSKGAKWGGKEYRRKP